MKNHKLRFNNLFDVEICPACANPKKVGRPCCNDCWQRLGIVDRNEVVDCGSPSWYDDHENRVIGDIMRDELFANLNYLVHFCERTVRPETF